MWKIFSKKIYKVICPSEELKQVFLDYNIFNEDQIKVIEDPHLIISNIYKFKNQKLNDNFFLDSKVLIAIGRMTKQKNYSFLIKNFKKLTSKYKDIKLLIIGSGEEKNDLKNLIKELDILEKVKLIDQELNIYKYLKNSDYYISTSIWEGSSLAMIDAAYMGIPILCSDCPSGRKEFIGENERGFLYRQNDSENFLNLFDKMYALDHNEIKKIILKAKKQTKKFTPLKNFLKLNKVLN
jgi:glycosyltransferase involved in cell wall biosynthesis